MYLQSDRRSAQQGFSVFAVIIVILLASFFGLLIVRMSPLYTDHWYVKNVVDEIAADTRSSSLNENDILDRMRKNLMINNVKFDVKNDFKIDQTVSPKKLILDYTKQVHIMANVDVVVSFHEEYTLQP
jgi:hypothetical protein